MEIKIKYFDDEITPIEKIQEGDWIDLRAAENVVMNKGDFAMIPLGVGMILLDGYEAHIAPRSSTFKHYGILQTNSVGIVDNSYSGEEDEWKMPVYATRDTVIHKNDRICQFRIVERQPDVSFAAVDHLNDKSRGGFGSTGVK